MLDPGVFPTAPRDPNVLPIAARDPNVLAIAKPLRGALATTFRTRLAEML